MARELTVQLSFRATEAERDALEKLRKKYGDIAMSAIIRIAVREFLEKNNG